METSRITNIQLKHVVLPLKKSYTNSLGSKDMIDSLVLIVKTDTDYSGLCSLEFDAPSYSEETWYEAEHIIRNEFEKILLRSDASDRNLIYKEMDAAVFGHLMSKALVDGALFDLQGKITGYPVYKLLGGKIRDFSQVIGWVGIDSEDKMLSEAEKFVSDGYSCLKFKIGANKNRIIELIRKLREELGYDFSIRLDANQSLTRSNALSILQDIYKFEIELLEQPVNRLDIQSLKFLNKRSPVPIMVDESVITVEDMLNIVNNEAASFVKVKVFRSGGIEKTKAILSVASSSGIECIIGNGFSSSIGTSVELSLAVTHPALKSFNEFVGPLKLRRDIVTRPVAFVKNKVGPLTAPGFGFSEGDLSSMIRADS